jgi:hypothetical protein
VKVDFGIPINPETFICIGKRNSVLKFSEEATLTLQGNSFDSWDTPEYEATIPWNENVLYLAEPTGLHTGPLRYWRFYVEDRENFNGYIEVSNLFFGKSWVPDRGCPQFGLSYQQQDLSVTVYSESGVSLTDLKPQTSSIGFDFKFMTKEDEEELRYIFEVYGTAKAFFLILDPEEVIVTNPQDLIKYVKFVQEPSIIFERPNVFSASITLREEL